jgi:uncharacterized protein YndB with AHSA1/START domain
MFAQPLSCTSGGGALICNLEVANMETRIEKRLELEAPVARAWRALTDYREFGEWFGVKVEAPFVPGELAQGMITHPGYQHLRWQAVIRCMEPQKLFSFTWHPYAVDPQVDYSPEAPTLVEFRLEPTATGTLLLLTESGFEKVPAHRRAEAFRMNEGGWSAQMHNIERHVARQR